MAIIELYSKRLRRLNGDVPEIYYYDDIPKELKVQIIHIIRDAFGEDKDVYGYEDKPKAAFKFIHKTLCREYGEFTLGTSHRESDEHYVLNFLLQTNEIENVLDVIELTFKYIDRIVSKDSNYEYCTLTKMTPKEAIDELNERFKEHGVGYQYANGDIIRVDSTYMHSEVVKPVLSLFCNNKFKGANDEYLNAHEHYRHGKNKECLNECLKSFESVLKIICKEKGWEYKEIDTSKKLISICLQNKLVPSFTQNQFTSLANLLESGIPTIRNKLGGHGQGQVTQKVDNEITRYALNLTGSNILFLIENSGIK